ncbi:hypothetical protein FRC07_002491 [Ceratobasidium sp. 392]|nr:hypothetical protein FRC07_002491 [Ceratobasidium sp. 392]
MGDEMDHKMGLQEGGAGQNPNEGGNHAKGGYMDDNDSMEGWEEERIDSDIDIGSDYSMRSVPADNNPSDPFTLAIQRIRVDLSEPKGWKDK